jgi:soluble lytic murein transglycosylase-like protein
LIALFQNLIFASFFTIGHIAYMPPPAVAVEILAVAKREHYDPFFLTAQVFAESSYKQGVVSSANCKGLMQVSYQIAQRYGGCNSLTAGTKYMKHLERRFHGNHNLALVAYNEGPTTASTGVVYPVTRRYVWRIHQVQTKLLKTAISLKISEVGLKAPNLRP